jgi:hypothetical protein
MHGLTSGSATMHCLVRSAIMLTAWTLAAALFLMPFAYGQTSSNGPLGVIVAAAICLFSGFVAEAASLYAFRAAPFGGTLLGMLVRMFVPLSVCVALLATGQNGRDHVYFIGYLLTFYMAMLALETWLAVKRTVPSAHSNRSHG